MPDAKVGLLAKVICIGSAVADTIFGLESLPSGGGKNRAHTVLETGGGLSANASVAISLLGGESALWSRVGDDPTGNRIIEDIAGYGVDVSGIQRAAGMRSPISSVCIGADGERQVVSYLHPQLFGPPHRLPLEMLPSARAVLADVRWPDGGTAALTEARKRGIPAVLDYERVATAHQRRIGMLKQATHVLFSADGLEFLSDTADVGKGLEFASRKTDAWVGVTCGEDGVHWLQDGIVRSMPSFEVDAVDTLGAGDLFHGAFALALAEAQSVESALRFASAASALKCTRFGGRLGFPTRAEVEDMLADLSRDAA